MKILALFVVLAGATACRCGSGDAGAGTRIFRDGADEIYVRTGDGGPTWLKESPGAVEVFLRRGQEPRRKVMTTSRLPPGGVGAVKAQRLPASKRLAVCSWDELAVEGDAGVWQQIRVQDGTPTDPRWAEALAWMAEGPCERPPAASLLRAAPPGFGCFAIDRDRRMGACVVGRATRGIDIPEALELRFFAWGGGEVADAISLIPWSDALRARVEAALQGFMVWAPAGWHAVDAATPKITLAAGKVELERTEQIQRPAGDNAAPRHAASLVVRAGGKTQTLDTQTDRPLSVYAARAVDLGAIFVVELSASEADEGYGASLLRAWRCDAELSCLEL